MMNKEQELYSTWTMKMMKEEADRLGIKIDTKGRKTKAADKILAAWKTLEEEKPEEAPAPEETKEEAPATQEPAKKRTTKKEKVPAENMLDYVQVILNTFDVNYTVSANGKDMKVLQDGEKIFELRRRAARVRVLIGDEGLARINPDLYTDDGGPGLSKKLNHSIYVDKENIMVVINSILA